MRWDLQFRESEWERNERMRKRTNMLKAEGKCWQCAKPVEDCACPNMDHTAAIRQRAQEGK